MPEFPIESIDVGSPGALLLIVVAVLIHDDLTCLVVASAVAAGKAEPLPAATACLIGIWLGDMAWFLSARFIGQKMLTKWPFRVLITRQRLQQAQDRFDRMGLGALFVSRFLPIARTPLQITSGLLSRSILPGCLTLLPAGVLYVTLFIGTAAAVEQTDVVRDFYQRYGAFALLAVSVALWSSVTGVRYFFLQKKSRPDF